MTDIRTIRPAEAEEFLGVLCDAFDLALGSAREVFYDEPFFDLDSKWAVFEDGRIVSILTLTPLTFGWGEAVGIAGVATPTALRGEGRATRLVHHVLGTVGKPALLFARQPVLYERLGFGYLDTVVRGTVAGPISNDEPGDMLDPALVERMYSAWASSNPNRLRRDDRRWQLWRWQFRIATDIPGGYLCFEPGGVREAIGDALGGVLSGVEWYGLSTLSQDLGLTLTETTQDLTLMGYRFPGIPQLFMTDQF